MSHLRSGGTVGSLLVGAIARYADQPAIADGTSRWTYREYGDVVARFIGLFRSHYLSGWVKALWFIFILVFPLIGVLVYLIVRGGKMHEHQVRDARAQEQELRRYVQDAAGSGSSADQLAKLADLRDRGVITAEEFDREKAKILA